MKILFMKSIYRSVGDPQSHKQLNPLSILSREEKWHFFHEIYIENVFFLVGQNTVQLLDEPAGSRLV